MRKIVFTLSAMLFIFASCGDNKKKQEATSSEEPAVEQQTTVASTPESATTTDFMSNKGIGPVKSITLSDKIDDAMAKKGEEHFKALCTACHKPDKKFIGPAPKGILERRSPEWVMNMIMNPEEMTQKDPIAMQLLKEANGAPMANQNVSEQQAREILEYFRTIQ